MSASPTTETIAACALGRTEYTDAWALQQEVQARLIADKKRARRDHVLLLVEHPPVYTLGKSGDADNMLLSEERLKERGATFHHIDRGGDITFHGPGQIVGYPILDLNRFVTDIHLYLRMLEEVIIRTCADFDVIGRRVEGRTGVWVGQEERECKICAMGIRCSRWVTMHGFALNVNTDLSYFGHIVPCGIQDRSVTSLASENGGAIEEAAVRERLLHHFGEVFEAAMDVRAGDDAHAFLKDFVTIAA